MRGIPAKKARMDVTLQSDRAVGRAPTKRYEARRNAIIASAVEVVNRRGVRGMTLGDVTASLDLVPTGVIYYFRNKEELAAAAFLRAIARYDRLIAAAAAAPEGERVAAFVRHSLEFRRQVAMGEAEQIALFNDVRALNAPDVNAAYVEMYRRARRLLPGGEKLGRTGRNARAHLMLAQLSWATGWLGHWDPQDYGRVAERMAAVMLDGMVPPGHPLPAGKPIQLVSPGADRGRASPEQFLRAAAQLINDEGYHGASVERISAVLNVSKGAFYHHNETKDELVVACFERTFELTWRAIRAAEAAGGSGLQVLVTVVQALVEHQVEGDAPLLRTTALTTVPEPIRLAMLEKMHAISLRFSSIVCDGIADGSIRPVDTAIAAQMITAAINAAAELHFFAPGVTPENAAVAYLRPLFAGMRAA
jgi:AcrR family transcriptional regulator